MTRTAVLWCLSRQNQMYRYISPGTNNFHCCWGRAESKNFHDTAICVVTKEKPADFEDGDGVFQDIHTEEIYYHENYDFDCIYFDIFSSEQDALTEYISRISQKCAEHTSQVEVLTREIQRVNDRLKELERSS